MSTSTRHLLLLVSAMAFVEVALFSAIAPLLPDYVDRYALSKIGAGILTAAYAGGALTGGLPAGYISSRWGPRTTFVGGSLLLAVACLAFAFAERIALLDAARFLQGFAGSMVWAGGLAWLILATPEDNHGRVIGSTLGTAVAGSLLGPALGAAAAAIGIGLIFAVLAAVSVGLGCLATRFLDERTESPQPFREIVQALTRRRILAAALFVAAPALMFGVISVLAPLQINGLGGGHALIAAAFIGGALTESAVSPLVGRYSDRFGRRYPVVFGLFTCAVSTLLVGLAASLGLAVSATVLASLGAGLCMAPAFAMMTAAADSGGLNQAYTAGAFNMAWALGQVVGGLAGGALAGLLGNGLASVPMAVLLLVVASYAAVHLRLTPADRRMRSRA